MVGVKRGTSKTAKPKQHRQIIGGWGICDAQNVKPTGPTDVWVVFSRKGAKRGEWQGPKGQAEIGCKFLGADTPKGDAHRAEQNTGASLNS